MQNKEISELLIQAMAFLELLAEQNERSRTEDEQIHDVDVMWAAHSHIQRAWGLIDHPDEATALSQNALNQVAFWRDECGLDTTKN